MMMERFQLFDSNHIAFVNGECLCESNGLYLYVILIIPESHAMRLHYLSFKCFIFIIHSVSKTTKKNPEVYKCIGKKTSKFVNEYLHNCVHIEKKNAGPFICLYYSRATKPTD